MIEGLIFVTVIGLIARELFRRDRPGVFVALLAGLAGTVAGAPIAHELSGDHEFHAFRAGSFVAALSGAVLLLSAYRAIRRRARPEQRRLFS